jgi:citrate synthase
MSEIIFEVTEDHLETGLRGVPVGYCPTSSVDPQKGLYYMGRPVSEMAQNSPEEVIYLLVYGHSPDEEQLNLFSNTLYQRANCSDELLGHIRSFPKKGHPMKLFNAALLLCGALEGKDDYKEDCLDIIAKVPEIAAAVINHHAGWDNHKSDPERGYMENFVHMLQAPDLDKDKFIPVMRLFDVLHFDHGGGNLSTFTGKCVASGLEDMYGSISASMCALAGPRHGKANQDSLEFVKAAYEAIGDNGTVKDAEEFVKQRLENKQLIFGFGHAVLRVEDPRATLQYEMAKELFPNNPFVKTSLLLREGASNVLKQNPKISNPYPNVDAISGSLLTASGFGHPVYYTVLFGLSRAVGIARQIVYERCEARNGKGTPIIRPKYFFKECESEAFSF